MVLVNTGRIKLDLGACGKMHAEEVILCPRFWGYWEGGRCVKWGVQKGGSLLSNHIVLIFAGIV